MSSPHVACSLDCSAFLNWGEEKLSSVNDKAVVFRSLVATVKLQSALDDSLERKAVNLLISMSPWSQSYPNAFLSSFASFYDESLANFIQFIVVLISSPSQIITTAAMKMLKKTVHIHIYLVEIIIHSLWLATPSGLTKLEVEDRKKQQAVHETVLQQVLVPLENCLTFFENVTPIWHSLYHMNNAQQDWNRTRGDERQMLKAIHRMLRMEGIDDALEERIQIDQMEQLAGHECPRTSLETSKNLQTSRTVSELFWTTSNVYIGLKMMSRKVNNARQSVRDNTEAMTARISTTVQPSLTETDSEENKREARRCFWNNRTWTCAGRETDVCGPVERAMHRAEVRHLNDHCLQDGHESENRQRTNTFLIE
ncbi:hypothetical protein BLNAU_6926 [Blattamonas nauphoetae]|uniref:Uncharacterized protein n=1 Tax=Blattamonas nauphoetae TaxID=2049346 RepID=A0ABQ9Y2N8_9EUKA|nr:hypothetical protein BLNAU_6926 [Blattamonas nauphoetae]